MSDDDATETELSYNQKLEIAKWFLLNSPAGEIQYVAKGFSVSISYSFFFFPFLFDFSMSFYNVYFLIIIHVLMGADIKAVLKDDTVYNEAAAVAFPLYNKSHMICLQFPNRGGDVNTLSIYIFYCVNIYTYNLFSIDYILFFTCV